MKKGLIIALISIAFIILIIAGFVYYKNLNQTHEDTGTSGGSSEQIPSEFSPDSNCLDKCKGNERCVIICENSDIIDKAIIEKDVNICEQLKQNVKSVCKDQVYLTRATKEDNVELCNNIIEENIKASCFDFYYFEKATSAKDLTHCDKINNSELKEICESIKK